jgi:hypothetical protein
MQRAQERDASNSRAFFFRRDVYTTNPSAASSVASSSRTNSPVDDVPRKRWKTLQNCFASPPLPMNGLDYAAVEDEYEEMTMKEIMTGKVITNFVLFQIRSLDKFSGYKLSRPSSSCGSISRYFGHGVLTASKDSSLPRLY